MTEETNELNDKDVQRIADALFKKMKEKQEKEAQEKLEKETGESREPYAVCTDEQCRRQFTKGEYDNFRHCPDCGGTKARIITK